MEITYCHFSTHAQSIPNINDSTHAMVSLTNLLITKKKNFNSFPFFKNSYRSGFEQAFLAADFTSVGLLIIF